MNNTECVFVTCLSDHLNREKTRFSEEIEYERLYNLAKNHDVVGMVYHQIKAALGKEQRFVENYSASVFYYAGRNRCFQAVAKAFREKGIRYAAVKGVAIDKLYPVPALRTMGDIDLLIREEDKPRIHQIMLDLGYECVGDKTGRDWQYKNKTIEFELHPLMIYPDEQVEKKEYIRFFNDFWQYVDENGNLKKEFHLLYLFVHLRKHLLNHGAGVRQFMDIAVFTRAYREEMDWNWIGEKLSELDLTRFAQMCYTFLYRWFAFQSPMEMLEISEELYESSTQRILENGVFGFQSSDDSTALASYAAVQGGVFGKIRHLLQAIFPSYALMQTMPEYRFVVGRPLLLPAAWVYRFVLVAKRGRVKNGLKGLQAKTAQDRMDMIQSWGM